MPVRRLYRCLLPLAAVVAGCATQPPPATSASGAPAAREPAPARASRPTSRRAAALLKQLPDRPLNVAAECSFRDPNGYQGRMKLKVRNAQVQRFEAQVDVPDHGSCRFDLAGFVQTAQRPVTLKNRNGDCAVHMWEQGRQVTVAFGECRSQCGGNARDYLWPILVNAASGGCS